MATTSQFTIWAVVIGGAALVLPRWFASLSGSLRIRRTLAERRRIEDLDIDLIAAFHQLYADANGQALDDRTWRDLDLEAVFRQMDRTRSAIGQQYLYHRLRTPRDSAESLHAFERGVRSFATDAATAERVCAELARLDDRRAAYLVHLLFGAPPSRPAYWPLFPALTVAALACLLLIGVWPKAVLVWLGICAVNVVVQLTYRPRVEQFVPALRELNMFLGVSRRLGDLNVDGSEAETAALRDGARALGDLRRATAWLVFEPGQTSDAAAMIYQYVNLLFLLDVNAFVFSTDTIRTHASRLRAMYQAVGTIDVAQSVAAWRASLPGWVTPDFSATGRALDADGVWHPLLAQPVPGTIAIHDTGVLITGSNMSGKTTFLRAMGVNAVLAQAVHTACAKRWRAPLLRVRTAIGRSDSIVEGKSYYLAEVESIRDLIEAKASGRQHLFLLDETFRGTNTVERVAGAYAVLRYLNDGPDIVIAATHDIELVDQLRGAYALLHFREEVGPDGLTFDYVLREGPSTTRNAIELLKVMRFPEAVVRDAIAAIDGGTA